MKTNTIVITAAALAAAGAGAHAQSSVTVFGIADAAVRRVDNSKLGAVWSEASGSNATSRVGFRGVEDLGGGLWAGFHLEHGLLLDAGTPAVAAQFWDRRATVSVGGKSWGEVRAGRDFVPTYVNWSRYDPFSYVGAAGSNNLVSATPVGPIRAAFGSAPNTTVRSSNAVQYLLPAGLGGVEGGVMFGLGEGGTAAAGQHKVTALRLGYAAASWDVSAAQTRSRNDITGTATLRDTALAGHVDVLSARLTLAWRRFELNQAKQTNVMFGASVPIGAGEIKFSWQRADLQGLVGAARIDANDATQTGFGYVHNLSKRTALYATASRIANHGAATFVVPGGPAGMAGGGRSTGVETGIRHTF